VRSRGDIWLADLAHAIAALQPADDRVVEVMARLLGIGAESSEERPLPAPRQDAGIGPVPPPAPAVRDMERQVSDRQEERGAENAERLEVLQPLGQAAAGWLRPWLLADDLEEFSERHTGGVRAHEPLFVRSWSRELLAAALAQQMPGSRVDEPRLVGLVAAARPVTEIPHRPRRSLSRGVQVLVDLGDGMEPFARDQSELLEGIRRVVGDSRVQVLQFRDSPIRNAGSGPIWTWKPYVPPEPGSPVLALTDLGIGGPAVHPGRSRPNEWAALASRLRRRSCPLVAFVPYGPERWPRRLARMMTIVEWDRSATVGKLLARSHTPPGPR
jgi:hypothetical protein